MNETSTSGQSVSRVEQIARLLALLIYSGSLADFQATVAVSYPTFLSDLASLGVYAKAVYP